MEVVIKVTNRYCDESQRRQEIIMCLEAFLCQQFLTIREWCKDIDVWVTGIVRIDKPCWLYAVLKCDNQAFVHQNSRGAFRNTDTFSGIFKVK